MAVGIRIAGRRSHYTPPEPRNHHCSHQPLMDEMPWQLTGLSNLTRLAVAACSLSQLPPGPYLHGLRELVLFANSLE